MNELNINELEKLANKYGNGFYLLDSDIFEKKFLELSKTFKKYYPNFNIAYSYKTNYIPKLCKIVNSNGGFAEIVSEMELDIALKSGVDYDRIIWNGPIKNYNIMDKFLISGGTVNIDNYNEWKHIESLANDNSEIKIKVGIRCNFDVGDSVLSRFGIDTGSKEFETICEEIASLKNVRLISIQCHFAKRNAGYWKKRTETMISIYEKLINNYGLQVERIDLGGGLSGFMSEDFANQIHAVSYGYDDFAESSAKILAEYFKDKDYKPLLVIEPGTALAADCMRAVFKVINIKSVRDKTIATVFGSQKNISMQGINPPMTIVHCSIDGKEYSNLDIAGYTCIESDYLYRGYSGKLAEGDFIILEYCGSYSIVMKPPFILPNFPIIDISNGVDNIEVIKREECFEDLFKTYNF